MTGALWVWSSCVSDVYPREIMRFALRMAMADARRAGAEGARVVRIRRSAHGWRLFVVIGPAERVRRARLELRRPRGRRARARREGRG